MEIREAITPIVSHRIDFSTQFAGPTVAPPPTAVTTVAPPQPAAVTSLSSVPPPPSAAGVSAGPGTGSDGKKKRGRPRKYTPDGKLAMALSPMPISSSIPLTGEYSAWKRGRGKPVVDTVKKSSYKYETESSVVGDRLAYLVGANFTPHMITVNAGEDVTMKIMTFSQQGSRAICILSAIGMISNVTLRQPTSSGGTLTYEGRFEILSLSGSYMPNGHGGTKGRSGGMSVSLASPEGRVMGGGLAGLLIAAGPVQVVVGSFLLGHQQEQKPKKPRTDPTPVTAAPVTVHTITAEDLKASYGTVKPIPLSSFSFHGDTSATLNPIQGIPNSNTDTKSSSPDEDDSQDHSLSHGEESG